MINADKCRSTSNRRVDGRKQETERNMKLPYVMIGFVESAGSVCERKS